MGCVFPVSGGAGRFQGAGVNKRDNSRIRNENLRETEEILSLLRDRCLLCG